jgi:PPOX class probable F420-dependent enzyme
VTTLEEAAALARDEHGLVIVATLRGDGTIQSSLVNAGIVPHPVTGESTLAFVTNGPVKLANLRARPQVTATFRNGWQWAAVEGHAELAGPDDPQPWPGPERLRLLLREIFSAADGEHDDWDACDRAMAGERRPAALVRPDRVYASQEHGHEDVPRLACRGPGVLRRSRSRQLQGLLDRPLRTYTRRSCSVR